jgi:hypothetical protein
LHARSTARRRFACSLPFDLPPVELKMRTHSRFASDAGIAWLRDMLVAMFA